MKNFIIPEIPEILQANLCKIGFKEPTEIQSKTIPEAFKGRDILGSAQTGTGKTAAYTIPILSRIINDPKSQGIILLPTRELAMQVTNEISRLNAAENKIRSVLLIGGNDIKKQLNQLTRQVQLFIGTPGRINDHIKRGSLKLNKITHLVLDEVDRMLDMGFTDQIQTIINNIPDEKQTLMFSATISASIQAVSKKYLKNPVRISVGTENSPTPNIKQHLFKVSQQDKFDKLKSILTDQQGSVIVFVKTKKLADHLSRKLSSEKMLSMPLHSNLKQNQRIRILDKFRKQKINILVATDIAARGLDIPHISIVINYDIAVRPEDHIHRIGRTARGIGATGEAFNFVSEDDSNKWKQITRLSQGPKNNVKSNDKYKAKNKYNSIYKKKTSKTTKYNKARNR